MDALINLIILVIVLGLILYLVIWLIDMLPLPHPFGLVAKVLILLVAILLLLQRVLPMFRFS